MPYQYVRETLKDGGKLTARLHDACQIALKKSCQLPANLTGGIFEAKGRLGTAARDHIQMACGDKTVGPRVDPN
jgi:hypothetical protein